jgi:hypothetical protein
MSIGLLLADDSDVTRHAIKRLLEEEPNIQLAQKPFALRMQSEWPLN